MLLPDPNGILQYVAEMRTSQAHFPFGKALSEKVIKRYSDIADVINCHGMPCADNNRCRSIRKAIRKCPEASEVYAVFKMWEAWDNELWIRNNRQIWEEMACFLPKGKGTTSSSHKWHEEMLNYLENATSEGALVQRSLASHQIYVDIINDVIRHASIKPELKSAYYRLQTKLYDQNSIVPSSVVLSPEDILSHEEVGLGASAVVYRAWHKEKEVAVKQYILRRTAKKLFTHETLILQSLRHGSVVPFIGIVADLKQGRLWIVSEYMPGGTINEYLRYHPNASRINMLMCVAWGLEFLHNSGIIHGDLKGDNVLIDSNGKARIADFGLASYVDHPPHDSDTDCSGGVGSAVSRNPTDKVHSIVRDHCTLSGVGTPRFMSPERHDPERYGRSCAQPTTESDVFSFGMLAYEIYSGSVPYHSLSTPLAVLRILKEELPERPELVTSDLDDLWELMRQTWSHKPSLRPKPYMIFFTLMNIETLWFLLNGLTSPHMQKLMNRFPQWFESAT